MLGHDVVCRDERDIFSTILKSERLEFKKGCNFKDQISCCLEELNRWRGTGRSLGKGYAELQFGVTVEG